MNADIHVLPLGDLQEHEETRTCWCAPWVNASTDPEMTVVVVHNSMDGRELVERHGVN